MSKRVTIDLSDSYQFKAFGNSVPLQPNPIIRGVVAQSYLVYADNYYLLAYDYTLSLDARIKSREKLHKKYSSSIEASNHDDYDVAHALVAVEMRKLPSVYTNACLAIELMLKALIAHDEALEDIDKANSFMKKKYGHNLSLMAADLSKRLLLTPDQISLVNSLNAMYSGIKRFQYPHSVHMRSDSEIPELQSVVAFAGQVRETVTHLISSEA